jgi:hypothetical protein
VRDLLTAYTASGPSGAGRTRKGDGREPLEV